VIASTGALVLNIVLVLVLVPGLGARGGAIADVITEAGMAIGLTAVLMRAVPQHQIKASALPPLVLASALAATVVFLPVGSVARVIGATIIYFGVLLLAGAIPDEIISAARRLRALRAPV
jgi:Na+-driven multidrug efflux pump